MRARIERGLPDAQTRSVLYFACNFLIPGCPCHRSLGLGFRAGAEPPVVPGCLGLVCAAAAAAAALCLLGDSRRGHRSLLCGAYCLRRHPLRLWSLAITHAHTQLTPPLSNRCRAGHPALSSAFTSMYAIVAAAAPREKDELPAAGAQRGSRRGGSLPFRLAFLVDLLLFPVFYFCHSFVWWVAAFLSLLFVAILGAPTARSSFVVMPCLQSSPPQSHVLCNCAAPI